MPGNATGCNNFSPCNPLLVLKKIYIISGEASGDLHAANLIKAMLERDSQLQFRCWGGDRMQEAGAEIVKHYRDLAFMGFIEVIMNLRTIMGNIKFCKEDIQTWKPDLVVLVDYPGFNLRIAEFLHQEGIPVHYYISPQIWAWKQNRVYKIRALVDKMYVILPFEQDFYKKFDYDVEFVGHPLLDVIEDRKDQGDYKAEFLKKNGLGTAPIIALLPGSRKQEISKMLPLMLRCMDDFPKHQFVIGAAPSQEKEYYQGFLSDKPRATLIDAQTYELMRYADAGLVTSGTATLEAALWGLPEVVCYKGSPISYWIARMLIKVKFIGLVNLVMDRLVVTELIQSELNRKNMVRELKALLYDDERKAKLQSDYSELWSKLGGAGASGKVADFILQSLHASNES